MTELQLFVFIIIIHFLSDFALQTHEQAINKSTSNTFLFFHVGVYSFIWTVFTIPILEYQARFLAFGLITFVCHFATDWITSRIGKPFWAKQDLHNGFVVVGFDQVLHYLQLYFTFKLLL